MKDKILEWFARGERGDSSEAMACVIAGFSPNEKNDFMFSNHPRDPSDFNRCVKFLDAVPEARQHLALVAELSEVWAKLVAEWDELESLLREELPAGKAPKLYQRMKDLGC